MKNFSYWQILMIAGILLVIIAFWLWYRTRNSAEKMARQKACCTSIIVLIQQYLELAGQLAQEYRYAFNHADELTAASEDTAERIIQTLELVEKRIQEKTQLLPKDLAVRIRNFLLQDNNKRHASPRDLENYMVQAPQEAAAITDLLRKKAGEYKGVPNK